MFKKILAIVLVIPIALSLVGCGKEVEDFYSILQTLASADSASYSGSLKVVDKSTDEFVGVSFSGVSNSNSDMSLSMGVKGNFDDTSFETPLNFLEMRMVNGDAYLNIERLFDGLPELLQVSGSETGLDSSMITGILSELDLDASWLMVPGGETLDVAGTTSVNIPDFKELAPEAKQTLADLSMILKEVFADVKPQLAGVDGDEYFFHLTDENVEAAKEALTDAYDSGKFDNVLKKVSADTKEQIEELIDQLANLADTEDEFDLCIGLKHKDSVVAMQCIHETESAKVDLSMKFDISGKDHSVEVPDDAATLEEILESLMGSLSGSSGFPGGIGLPGGFPSSEDDWSFDTSGDEDWSWSYDDFPSSIFN